MLEESTSTSSFLNIWRAVSSSSEFLIESGRPLCSKHSRLEYWQLSLQRNHLVPQFWAGLSGDAKFWLHFLIILSEIKYFFIYVCQGWIKLVLVFQSQKAITSSLDSFFSADPDNDSYLKTSLGYLLKSAISITDYYHIWSLCLLTVKKLFEKSTGQVPHFSLAFEIMGSRDCPAVPIRTEKLLNENKVFLTKISFWMNVTFLNETKVFE